MSLGVEGRRQTGTLSGPPPTDLDKTQGLDPSRRGSPETGSDGPSLLPFYRGRDGLLPSPLVTGREGPPSPTPTPRHRDRDGGPSPHAHVLSRDLATRPLSSGPRRPVPAWVGPRRTREVYHRLGKGSSSGARGCGSINVVYPDKPEFTPHPRHVSETNGTGPGRHPPPGREGWFVPPNQTPVPTDRSDTVLSETTTEGDPEG